MAQQLKVIGMEKLQAKLRTLPKKVQTKGIRKALTAGTTPLLSVERSDVPVDTGLLKKSLGKKVKLKGGGGYGIVGPRKGFGVPTKKSIKFKARKKGEKRQPGAKEPTRYAHLAEKKKPFVDAAFTKAGSFAVHTTGKVLGEFIESEARA